MSFQDSAPVAALSPEDTYVGRAYFYLSTPAETLASGYDRIKVYRRKSPADPTWIEITNVATRMVIEESKHNYTFLDEKAQRSWQYRPSLSSSGGVLPDIPQTNYIQDAVDTAFETVLTPQELRDIYCWGLLSLFVDDVGNPFPERLYAHYIRYGIGKFEAKTRLHVLPTKVEEFHDYIPRDWDTYMALQLDEYPVLSVESVSLMLPGQDPVSFPTSWFRLDKATGVLHLVPDNVNAGGMAVRFTAPLLQSRYIPQALRVRYTAGFAPGQLPGNLKDMIGKESSSGPLNIGGDLVGGAAIASQSMSLDGLSQSVNTTSSATSAGFGSRLIQYNAELKRDYPVVINFYKGARLYMG